MSPQQSEKLYNAGEKVVLLLHKNGNKAFFVGGYVRNDLLKLESDNIDIATDATADEVEKILQKNSLKVKPVGKRFGSVLAIVNDLSVEITTFRAEGRYSDKRHPDQVEFIKEYLDDAKRRDFTVNALYYDPIEKKTYDPTNGLKDLKAKLLRFVGDPKKRIDEDALRMLRGMRLATQLGFKLEKNSFAAIKTRAKYIQEISGERIKSELDKILLSENRVTGFELLDNTGLLKFIIPEFEKLKTVFHGSKKYHLEGSVFTHTKLVLSKIIRNELTLVYAALFHDIGKVMEPIKKLKEEGRVFSYRGHEQKSFEIFESFAARLKFPRKEKDMIGWLIKYHDIHRDFLNMRPEKQYQIASHPAFYLLIDIWKADLEGTVREGADQDLHAKRRLETQAAGKAWLKKIEISKPLIDKLAKGDVIMKYSKLKPGIQLGAKIEDVKLQIIFGKIKTEADLRNYLNT